MKSSEIRQQFLDYFKSKGHAIVASSPLVPGNDPTLLFTNAGMVQFKDLFLGHEQRDYKRATTSQRCVRAGGKHNDLENVGYTARHHTFFEMLGNFSFGDYFKKDAIHFAWELLTGIYKLPKEKLWVTVYETDDEAYNIWANEIRVPRERITRIGDKPGGGSDNFWQMGETGPCGPCTEIFYDHGAEIPGGPPGTPEADGDRYIEIWNLVFMQFNRDDNGKLHPLPKPSVDTGMGLERIAAVLQGVHSNYEIDLFQDLIKAAARETACKDLDNNSLKVIADHIRACSFLIVDGVIPSNEGRGYVLRRIVRRAIRHGYKLGQKKTFFHKIVPDLVKAMGVAYPELVKAAERVGQVLKQEEERFIDTIDRGMSLLERGLTEESLVISKLRRIYNPTEIGIEGASSQSPTGTTYSYDARFTLPNHDEVVIDFKRSQGDGKRLVSALHEKLRFFESHGDSFGIVEYVFVVLGDISESLHESLEAKVRESQFKTRLLVVDSGSKDSYRVLDGRIAFTLHDTYGFPLDLTADVARERGILVDEEGFEAAMEEQRQRARSTSKFITPGTGSLSIGGHKPIVKTEFHGYETLELDGGIVAIYKNGSPVDVIEAGDIAIIVLDKTPFYAESGGQVGDRGQLVATSGTFHVSDTRKIQPDIFGHHGVLHTGRLVVGDTLKAQVDVAARSRIMRNHSATHLMHKALREVLGAHVQQKGSLVDGDKTRFDFSHDSPLSADDIRRVESIVNAEILTNAATSARVMKFDEAAKVGAVALFGEKYGDEVRVLDIGTSRELCGGTHVARTGDIGLLKITSESGVAAGIRRVEAVTGEGALEFVQNVDKEVTEAASLLGVPKWGGMISLSIGALREDKKQLEKELARLKSKLASSQGDDLAGQAAEIKGAKVLAAQMDGADAKALREAMDKLKDKLKSCVLVLAAADGGKVTLLAGVSADLTSKVKAGELVNFVAQQVGGKGGGRPDMAQAGGTDASKLPEALASVNAWVEQKL